MESNNIPKREEKAISDEKKKKKKKKFMRAQIVVRVLASLTTFAAALLMGLNKETVGIIGLQMTANYKSSPAFVFFVGGNAVACGYSLISLPLVFNNLVGANALPIMDLVNMGLVMASASAASAIAYLGKKGNDHVGWSKVCPYFDKFCDRVGISLILSYLGFFFLLLICSLSSVYKTSLAWSKNASHENY